VVELELKRLAEKELLYGNYVLRGFRCDFVSHP
jgi:hypothetical protein